MKKIEYHSSKNKDSICCNNKVIISEFHVTRNNSFEMIDTRTRFNSLHRDNSKSTCYTTSI